MPATLTTVSAILKEIYEGSMNDQLNNDVVALKRIQRTSDGVSSDVGGKYVVFPIKTTRNSGIGARNELEALPTPGQQGVSSGRVGLKYLYGSVRMSGQTFELANTNPQAFMSTLDLEMEGLKTDLQKDLNRQVYGDGTGAIATVTATYTTANAVVVGNVQYVQLGEQIDILQSNGTVIGSNRKVTAINTATKTVTFDGAAISGVATNILVRTGNYNREWTGLSKIVNSSGTLYNIDPTVDTVWVSSVDSNSGVLRALSESLMINMVDAIRTNGGSVSLILQNLGVRRAYFNLLVQQRRYSNTKEFGGGFSGLAFTTDQGEIPVVADVDAPPSTQYFLSEKQLKWYRESDWSFMDRDGSKWLRVSGFDAYDATMFQYSELGTHRRNAHGVIKDITEA